MKSSRIVRKLVDKHGFTKYELHKLVGVSWNTVHMWYLGVFQPKDVHKELILKIYNEKTEVVNRGK